MDNIKSQLKMCMSRIYVRILSATRATHSWSVPKLKPKSIHIQNRKSFVYLIFIIVALFALYIHALRAPLNFPKDQLITLESGKPLSTLAMELESEGVVRSADMLTALVRLRGGADNVHAGDYILHESQNVFTIARIITTGAFGLEPMRVTIPEGVGARTMAELYANKMMRFKKQKFIKLALPNEGYLFPDTYFFLPNATEQEIVDTMMDNFDQHISEFEDVIESSGKTLDEIVIMASIVEKEAHIHKDRKLIAGALWNRLDINMPLQVDATFIYTHNKGSSDITMAELLDSSNEYNTYKHAGLPPGAISNPGLSALKATIYPTENPYLFYLADRYGRTYFSKTYEEHMVKRNRYINY